MTIDQAIEILQALSRWQGIQSTPRIIYAIELGIEALKREQYHRSCFPNCSPALLPGETE